MYALRLLRPLGFAEARMHASHEEACGTTDSVVALRLEGPLDTAAVQRSAERLHSHHQILTATIVEHDGRWWFADGGDGLTAPLIHVPRRDENSWRELFRALISQKFDAEGSLLRWYLVHDGGNASGRAELLLHFHHAILDGVAVLALLDELLRGLTEQTRPIGSRRALSPPAEAGMPCVDFEGFRATQAAIQRAGAAALYRTDNFSLPPLTERVTRSNFLTLDPPQLARLHQRCQRERVTLTSLVAALLLQAVDCLAPPETTHGLFTPYSLRRLLDATLAEDELGCFISVLPTYHRLTETDSTDQLARAHAAALSRVLLVGLKHPHTAPATAALRAMVAQTPSIRAHDGPVAQTLGLSFLPRSLKASYGALSVTEMYGAANRTAGAQALVVHATLAAGRLCFVVNSTAPLQTNFWFEHVTNEFSRRLDHAASE